MKYIKRIRIAILFIANYSTYFGANAQNAVPNTKTEIAATRYIRFGIGLSEDHPQGMAVKRFAQIVAEKTQSRIKIELVASSKLDHDVSMVDALLNSKFGQDWTKRPHLRLAMNEHSKLQRSVSR
jgi:TRAP-type C4-dicarboxylate transport system substrate-binding protein